MHLPYSGLRTLFQELQILYVAEVKKKNNRDF